MSATRTIQIDPDDMGIVRAHAHQQLGLSGHYVFTVYDSDEDGCAIESTARVVAQFDNLITDTGLDCIGNALSPNSCVVGSGGNTPAYTDTALTAQVASTSTVQSTTDSYNASPEYAQRAIVFRFAAGVAAGNLAEVGTKAGTALYSHALVLDGSGNATTITILPTEVLDVTFISRVQPPSGDISGNVVIGGVTYNTTSRPSGIGLWYQYFDYQTHMIATPGAAAFSGNIGGRNSQPSGTQTNITPAPNAYSNGAKSRTWTGTWQLNDANYANGIASFLMNTLFSWQYSIDSGANVPKTASKVLAVTFNVSWDRA